MDKVFEIIKNQIEQNDIVLYMKGTATFPQCGFSSKIANILNKLEVKYLDINVLEDANIREGIKKFTNWPTLPQLYIKGEFIGGCDIVRELFVSGELQEILAAKSVNFTALQQAE